jgi:hypothetical protein
MNNDLPKSSDGGTEIGVGVFVGPVEELEAAPTCESRKYCKDNEMGSVVQEYRYISRWNRHRSGRSSVPS